MAGRNSKSGPLPVMMVAHTGLRPGLFRPSATQVTAEVSFMRPYLSGHAIGRTSAATASMMTVSGSPTLAKSV